MTARACFCGRVSVLSLAQFMRGFKELTAIVLNRGRISSVGRALDCRAGGGRFDPRGRTNAHGLKITANKGTASAQQTASPSRGSDDHGKWRSLLQYET